MKVDKRILSLALPMSLVQFISTCSMFFCMAMLAHLGHEVLAASALIFSTQFSFMILGTSLLFATGFLIGHAHGGKNAVGVGSFLQHAWLLALIISTLLILLFKNIGIIMGMLHQPPVLIDLVQSFFNAYVWAVFPFSLAVCNQQLCYGTGQQKLAMLASILNVVVLLASAYVLIFGKFGAPALGVEGLGYAMALQAWFSFLFILVCFCCMERFKGFQIFHIRLHKNLDYLKKMLKVSWPITVQFGGEMLSFFVATSMVGWLGIDELGAYQVVSQYLFLFIIPIFALSQAVGILVGQARGAKNFHEVEFLGSSALKITLLYTLMVALVFVLFPKFLAALYLDASNAVNAQTLHLIVVLFVIIAFSQMFDAVRNVLTGALRGLFDSRYPMLVSLVVIWLIGVPLEYILAFVLHVGLPGIVLGSAIAMLIGAVVLLIRWRKMSHGKPE